MRWVGTDENNSSTEDEESSAMVVWESWGVGVVGEMSGSSLTPQWEKERREREREDGRRTEMAHGCGLHSECVSRADASLSLNPRAYGAEAAGHLPPVCARRDCCACSKLMFLLRRQALDRDDHVVFPTPCQAVQYAGEGWHNYIQTAQP